MFYVKKNPQKTKSTTTPLPLVSCLFLGTNIKLIYETSILTIRDSVINNANTIKKCRILTASPKIFPSNSPCTKMIYTSFLRNHSFCLYSEETFTLGG